MCIFVTIFNLIQFDFIKNFFLQFLVPIADMKITGINNKNIMFSQNQIYIYSDFDRTVSPNTTYDVLYAHDKNKIQKAKYNFDLINSLLNKYPKIKLFII